MTTPENGVFIGSLMTRSVLLLPWGLSNNPAVDIYTSGKRMRSDGGGRGFIPLQPEQQTDSHPFTKRSELPAAAASFIRPERGRGLLCQERTWPPSGEQKLALKKG